MTTQHEFDISGSILRHAALDSMSEVTSRRRPLPLSLVPDPPDQPPGEVPPRRGATNPRARRYLKGHLRWLRATDLLAIAVAVVLTTLLRFGLEPATVVAADSAPRVSYWVIGLTLGLAWVGMLHLMNAYDGRFSGHGVQEYRQVFHASLWLFSTLAIIAFAFRIEVARGYVLIAFPLGTALLLLSRWVARRWLVARRRDGGLSDRVLLVGDQEQVSELVVALSRAPDAGFSVIGACVDDGTGEEVAGVPVLGAASEVLSRGVELDVDVIAVSSSADLGRRGLQRLGWALEDTDIDLVVAPGIMDVAGPRVVTRPVQGLPLIHVDAPRFSGPTLVFKNVLDRVAAGLGILVLLPVLLGLAVAIYLDDRGSVLFSQDRVGRDGRTFRMLKFRSMCVDAEAKLPALMAANEGAGPMFKMREDPRITRIGRFIRRYSLDELPQLINVLRGDMSLVGPRPPLPREVATYAADTRRRLLVKPGLTGLWQISGRNDLPWEESVRLDLYYVENWTPLLDLMILWRTGRVVVRPDGAGAY